MTNSKEDREHVTLHIRKNPKIFNIINIVAPNSLFYPKLGLTLDYYRDYILIKKIIEHFNKIKNTYFTCEDIINLYEKNNMFFNVNKNVKRNVIKI